MGGSAGRLMGVGRAGSLSQDSTMARRADADMVRLGTRDVAGLVLSGEMYAPPASGVLGGLGASFASREFEIYRFLTELHSS